MRISLLISAVILILGTRAFPQTKTDIDCPGSWGPGRYSKVTVTVSFDKKEGFARFTQDFPVGFRIIKDVITEGDFSWNGSQLNVVWMKIPSGKEVRFSYFIMPEPQMQGDIDLNGKLVIVSRGTVKSTLPIGERRISIGGTGGLLPEEMKKGADQAVTVQTEETKVNTKPPASTGPVYRVQIATSAKEISAEAMKKKLGIVSKEKITVVKSGNVYKYQMGEFSDKASASGLQKQLVAKGIKDAFVVTAR